MQTANAMLSSSDPPHWIVALSEADTDYEAHAQIALADIATISILGDAHDGPLDVSLSDAKARVLRDVLSKCSHSTIVDVRHDVLDGLLCAVAVINLPGQWCAFSEFNIAGMPHTQLAMDGPRIASLIQSIHRDLRSVPSGP